MIISEDTICGNARGAVILLVLVIVLAVLYVGVLVVDVTTLQHTTRVLQFSADAASLAGATELSLSSASDMDRWKNAKRAALGMLREHLILHGYRFPDLTNASYHSGNRDSCELTGEYRSQIFDNGDVRIELERGVYSDDDPPDFASLESPATCHASHDPLPNALQVTVTVYESIGIFASASRFKGARAGPLSRNAIGAQIY